MKKIDRQLAWVKIKQREQQMMGRKITVVDAQDVGDKDGGVRILVYDLEPVEMWKTQETSRVMHERRCAVYRGDHPVTSIIVKTWFTD